MSTPALRLRDRDLPLPELLVSLALASEARLLLEAGPLRMSLSLPLPEAHRLLAGGDPIALGPQEDPVFLEGEGVLDLAEARLLPEGDGAFLLEARGMRGWGASAAPWTLQAGGRVGTITVEHRSEKGVRARLAEVLPAVQHAGWSIDAFEVPEMGLWRLEAER